LSLYLPLLILYQKLKHMKIQTTPLKFKLLFSAFLLTLICFNSSAVTRPTFSDTPFGFANVGGDFSGLIPACDGSTTTVRVTTSTELTNAVAAAGTTKKIIIVAPGNYNAITI